MQVYLDNATLTKPLDEALDAMRTCEDAHWQSHHSPYGNEQSLKLAQRAYEDIYALVGAKREDVFVLTSGAHEAVSQVIQSVYHEVTRQTGKNQFITASIDEAPQIMAISKLEQWGCTGRYAQADHRGAISEEAISDSISPRTALVSLSWANALTGVIHPIEEIAQLCKERGILLHVDVSACISKIPLDFHALPIDYLSFGGDLFHAPRNCGGVFVKKERQLHPLIMGSHDQAGLRAGPMYLASLLGLSVACRYARESLDYMCTEVARLKFEFEEAITSRIKQAQVCFADTERLASTTAIIFPHQVNELLLFSLFQKDVFASFGGGNQQKISLVLQACGIDPQQAQCALNFTLSRFTKKEELERAVAVIAASVDTFSKLSEDLFRQKELFT